MLFDLEKTVPSDVGIFDVCIIGTGAAGLALASELSKGRIRILLLEGGGDRYERRTQDLYSAETFEQKYTGAIDGRIRVLGGTTTQWGGQIVEPDDFVFRTRSWINGSGWPFDKKLLAPYYLKAEKLEGIGSAYTNPEAIWRQLDLAPIDFNGQLYCDYSRFCPITNFVTIHSNMIRTQENVFVFLHANACELTLKDGSQTVRSVRCRTLKGRTIEFYARSVVLCMGGIENSRFLLQPKGDGVPSSWNRYGLVGRFFQDHISSFVADISKMNMPSPDKYFDYSAIQRFKYHLKLKLPLTLQDQLKTLDMCGTIVRKKNVRDDLAQAYETARFLKMRRFEKLSRQRLINLFANVPQLLWHKLPYGRSAPNFLSKNTKMSLCVHCEQSPTSDSSVSLTSKRDVLGLLQARVKWSISDLEIHSIQSFATIVRQTFQRNRIGEVSVYPEIVVGGAAAASHFRESHHHIGGTRMATTETQGVVDLDLKLYGTDNVFVCGSSVFPCAGFANPTHTIIALAIRLADHLKEVLPRLAYDTDAVPAIS